MTVQASGRGSEDGPLLEGFTLPDAPEFDRWQRNAAAELHAACRDALERLAGWATARQAPGEVARYLQQLAQLDPLDEATQRRLVSFYLQAGSLAKALRQFETLEAELRKELGVSPEPETLALIRDALSGRKPSRQLPHASVTERLPLFGREGAYERLSALARDVVSGHGATVLVQGDDVTLRLYPNIAHTVIPDEVQVIRHMIDAVKQT